MHKYHVIGGGTMSHVRPHLALCAPAYGTLARDIWRLLRNDQDDKEKPDAEIVLQLTTMAGGEKIETNEDLGGYLQDIIRDPASKIVFMTAAPVDFSGSFVRSGNEGPDTLSGKDQPRIESVISSGAVIRLKTQEKLLRRIRKERKDIFLIGCKTTTGATPDQQFVAGLRLLKEASCNLVLANDTHTRFNMVITPEQARYHETTKRNEVVEGLVKMALARSKGTFTRSTIVPGEPVPWSSELVPASLRTVVDHCIKRGAYETFMNSTVGHFAVKIGEGRFLTSRRKTNYNKLDQVGMVLVETAGDDRVIAHGSRPSVGGQSQRIVFTEHPDADCIVHFHCPLKRGAVDLAVQPQWNHECGSHGCGKNTSDGLRKFGNLYAVMLDKHGPNIVFHRDIDPEEVIRFIEANFDITKTTQKGTFVEPSTPSVAAINASAP